MNPTETDLVERLRQAANSWRKLNSKLTPDKTLWDEAADLIERLPKDTTGRRVAPGMSVWCLAVKTGVPIELKVDGFCDQANGMHLYLESPKQPSRVCFKNHESIRPDRCYPTRELAEAAKEKA